jgi:hypothetical protein
VTGTCAEPIPHPNYMIWRMHRTPGEKNGLLEPCLYKNDHFAKTGSGKHRENSKKDAVFRTV